MSLKKGMAPNINLMILGYMEERRVTLLTQKEDIHLVMICLTHLRDIQIAVKQLYHSSRPLHGPLGTNEKTKLVRKEKDRRREGGWVGGDI